MKIQREMVITSLEQMCDLMCGGIEEDEDLVCDTDYVEQCIYYTVECEGRDCSECSVYEEEYDEYTDDRAEALVGSAVQNGTRR